MTRTFCDLRSVALALLIVIPDVVLAQAKADVVMTGGKIFTADSTRPWATAIAIRGDRIVAVGSDADVAAFTGAATRRIPLAGRVVVPGFNDAHTHVGADIGGVTFATSTSPTPDPVFSVVRDSVAAIARRQPPGVWISTAVAEAVLGDSAARRVALDRAAPRNPVLLRGWSGHGAVLNTAALLAAHVDTLHDPVGGWLERDASERVTGRLDEYALFGASLRLVEARGAAATVAAFAVYNGEAAAFGLTSAQNMSTALTPALLRAVENSGVLRLRHHVIAFEGTRVGRRDAIWRAARIPSPLTRIAGAKWVLDGTPIERLALMREPYADRPGWYGRANFSFDTLKAMLRDALMARQQPILHAVGDSTIALVFSAMRALAPDSVWRALRPRIEHGDQVMPDQFAAAKSLGIIVVQNPTHLALPFRGTRWTDARASSSEALRSILTAGIPIAIGSDGPLNTGLNIMLASLNPANPGEALTREQAVIAYTRTAAYAEGEEREKGMLRVGMLADLAVLSQDIFTVPPPAMPGTTSLMTMVGGRMTRDVTTSKSPAGEP